MIRTLSILLTALTLLTHAVVGCQWHLHAEHGGECDHHPHESSMVGDTGLAQGFEASHSEGDNCPACAHPGCVFRIDAPAELPPGGGPIAVLTNENAVPFPAILSLTNRRVGLSAWEISAPQLRAHLGVWTV